MGQKTRLRLLSQDWHVRLSRALWWLTLVIVCSIPAWCQQEECNCTRLQTRIDEIEQEVRPKLGPVRLHRVEELEEEVFIPTLGSTNIESSFLMYQLQQRQFFVRDGEVAQNPNAGSIRQYVAISRDGKHMYRLAGCPEAEKDFQRLVTDSHMFIGGSSGPSQQDAETRALYCAKVVYGYPPEEWVYDEDGARLLAAKHFVGTGAGDAFRQADHWWQDYRRKHSTSKLGVTTKETGAGTFITRLPVFLSTLEGTSTGPDIRDLEILVDRGGACHLQGQRGGT